MQVRALLMRSRQQVLGHLEVLLPALFDALSGPSDRVVLEALSVQVSSLKLPQSMAPRVMNKCCQLQAADVIPHVACVDLHICKPVIS